VEHPIDSSESFGQKAKAFCRRLEVGRHSRTYLQVLMNAKSPMQSSIHPSMFETNIFLFFIFFLQMTTLKATEIYSRIRIVEKTSIRTMTCIHVRWYYPFEITFLFDKLLYSCGQNAHISHDGLEYGRVAHVKYPTADKDSPRLQQTHSRDVS
jgi:hypothetical protein